MDDIESAWNEEYGVKMFILDSHCDNDVWIIQDILSGSIRVWDNTSDELFFGKGKDIVFERTDKGEYKQIAV